jgi:hypothetical protein
MSSTVVPAPGEEAFVSLALVNTLVSGSRGSFERLEGAESLAEQVLRADLSTPRICSASTARRPRFPSSRLSGWTPASPSNAWCRLAPTSQRPPWPEMRSPC